MKPFRPYYTREDLEYQMEHGIDAKPDYLIEHIFYLLDRIENLKIELNEATK